MKKKQFYYDPSMTQDFADIQIKGKDIPSNFKYVHKSLTWRFFAFCFLRFLAIPILWAYSKILYRPKVINKKAVMKQLKGTGYFMYSNHTLTADGWLPSTFICHPRQTYIISLGSTFTFNPILTFFISQLGGVPLPSDLNSARNFMHCLKQRLEEKAAIAIYPEGTIWPYYTKARVTKKGSFKYPRAFNKPVIFACTTFRKPKGPFKAFLKPKVIITLSDPIFPNRNSVEKIDEERLKELFDQFIEEVTSNKDNYCPYDYIQREVKKDYIEEHFDENLEMLQDEEIKKNSGESK